MGKRVWGNRFKHVEFDAEFEFLIAQGTFGGKPHGFFDIIRWSRRKGR